MTLFLKGLLIALIFGVPAGAIGALTVQRTLRSGWAAGFVTGLGSSAADLCYAALGLFGWTALTEPLLAHTVPIRLGGCALILLYGVLILLNSRPKNDSTPLPETGSDPRGLAGCFLSSFAAAILNPAAILSFLAAFAAFGLGELHGLGEKTALLAGILIGTAVWWAALAGITVRFRAKVMESQKLTVLFNRILGALLCGFAAIIGVSCIFQH